MGKALLRSNTTPAVTRFIRIELNRFPGESASLQQIRQQRDREIERKSYTYADATTKDGM